MKERRNMTEMPVLSNTSPRTNLEVESANIKLLRHRARTVAVTQYPPPRTAIAACLFLVGGITFLIAGLVVFFGPVGSRERGMPMLILGSIS